MLKLLIAFLLLSLSTNQVIKGVYQAKGINQKNTESNISQYKTRENTHCKRASNVVHKAKDLIRNKSTDLQKATALYNFVRDSISYVRYDDSQRGASTTLTKKGGNCCDQTNLLVAMCRAVDIPVRYVHGTGCKFSSGTYGHVWAQILIGDWWFAADTTSVKNSLGFINNWNYKSYNLASITPLLSF